MAAATNPAERLRRILSVADNHRSNNPAPNVWVGILNTPLTPPDAFFRRVSALTALVAEVRALVAALPASEDPEFILRDYGQVETTVANFLNIAGLNMSSFMSPLEKTGLLSLEMADRALRRAGYRDPQLDDNKIAELREQVQELIAAVFETDDLSTKEKRSIIAHLRAVDDVLDEALFSGEDVQQRTEGLIGAIVNLPSRLYQNEVIRRVATFSAGVMVAVATQVAADQIDNAIESPASPPAVVVLERVLHGTQPAAISSANTASEEDEHVVDAEVVEDERGVGVGVGGTAGEDTR